MTRRSCPTFEELSQLFSAKNREMIASHLATCDACAGVWADLEALREAAQQIPTRSPTAAEAIHLEDRLLSAALAPAPMAPTWRRYAAPLAAAAVAAGVTLFFTARPDDAPRTAVVQAPAGAQFEHFTRVERDAPREVVRVREGRVSIEAADEAAPLEVLTADGTIEVQSSDFEVVVVDDRLSEVFVRSGQVAVRTPDGATHIVRLGERWTRPARPPREGAPSARAAKVGQADAEAGAGGTTADGASQPTVQTAPRGAGALATHAGTPAREGGMEGASASARTGAGAHRDSASASPRRDGTSASSRTGAGAGGIAGARTDGASASSRRDGASSSSRRGAGAGASAGAGSDGASVASRRDGASLSSRRGAGAGASAGAGSDGASASSRRDGASASSPTGAERAGASEPSRVGVASASSRAGAAGTSRVGVGSASSRAGGVSPDGSASSGRGTGVSASSRTAAGAASPGASASAADSPREHAGPGAAPPASGDGASAPDAGTTTPPLPTPAERAFASGWRLLRAGDPSTAAERFAEVLEHQPGGALAEDARYWRAAALAKADAADATPALRAYLAAHPEGRRAAEVTLMLAWRRLADGDEVEAKALFERAAATGDARVKKAARRGLDQL